ncbi:glycosyl transferase family 1 [Hypericibacter adhaerens]|jgi:MGT family glycosyltransferase|uniref:Glycosyl transferase family 1 n=3 Tax=Hypericibacter adhaerens TaxID=2602016 RepID=A0A5J6N462_9PROT|nr:glycosyltransferase [Hypericibacter adhaerens]QEX24842.1 glycosyl transferase family 1 [Hypericibacter adhaerens]
MMAKAARKKAKTKAKKKTGAAKKTSAKRAAGPKTAAKRKAAKTNSARKSAAGATSKRSSASKARKAAAKPKATPKKKVAPKPKKPAASAPLAPAKAGPATPSAPRPALKKKGKRVVLYPEAAFGPALNCVGIAQRLREMGHEPIFVCDKGFKGVFEGYGFEEKLVDMSGGMPDEEAARFWSDFIAQHLPHFKLSPIEQIPTYVVPVWEMIVDTAVNSHEMLLAHLQSLKPDVVCVDNVILFPAIKMIGKPWIRIISCSENEVADPDIPPHLSGCGENDKACFQAFEAEFLKQVKPAHDRFNAFLAKVGHPSYELGEFFETSPYLNLLLYPKHLRFKRRHALDPKRFQYLDGCVRDEGEYKVPKFAANEGKPLIYVSFGSLGSADVELYKRMIALFGRLPYRFLMNVGDYIDQYHDVPGNVHLEKWYPQPAVIPHVDLFIHHGGNNSFNEALYFGKPAIIMPYCWDGLDNATRIQDTGYGAKLPRYAWSDDELAGTIARLIGDGAMKLKLGTCARYMQSQNGPEKAARLIARVAEEPRLAEGVS